MKRLVVLFVLAFAVAPAAADDASRAKIHMKQGKAFADAGQYDAAITEFEAAFAIDGKAQTLFVIGNVYYKKQDYKRASEYFRRYLTAEPEGKYSQQALEFTAIANKALADEEAKQKAARDEQNKQAALAHVKQGDAYAAANAWVNAGDEYRAATAKDGDPEHLFAAAEAYRKGNADDKAKETYRAYLDKVPLGGRSDEARGNLAELSRAAPPAPVETKQVDPKPHAAFEHTATKPRPRSKPEPDRKRRWWLVAVGGALLVSGAVADLAPQSASNGQVDPEDFAPVGLYGLGAGAVLGGVIRW